VGLVSRRRTAVENPQLSVLCDNAVVKCKDGLNIEMWDERLEGSARPEMGEMGNARTQNANALSALLASPLTTDPYYPSIFTQNTTRRRIHNDGQANPILNQPLR
jgi:hypothetical protein